MNEEVLIKENEKLVDYTINKLHIKCDNEEEYQDIRQDGMIGMLKGIRTYDENSGYSLSTYLYQCIANEIKHYLTIKNAQKRNNANGLKNISLDTVVIHGEKNDITIQDIIPDNKVNIEKEIEKNIKIEVINNVVKQLHNKKDIKAFELRYGLNGNTEHTIEEVAEILGVSRQMIYTRITRATDKVKRKVKGKERKIIMNNTFIEKNNGEILSLKDKEDTKKSTLNEINIILMEQLQRLRNLDMTEKEETNLEIKRSNAISNTSKTILQTIGLELMTQKQKYKFLELEENV